MSLSVSDIPSAFEAARQALDRGDLAAAREALAAIEAARPGLPEVAFQRGRLATAEDDFDTARAAFDAALAQHPKEMAIWAEIALMEARAGSGAAVIKKRAAKAGLPSRVQATLVQLAQGRGLKAEATGGMAKPLLAQMSQGAVPPAQMRQALAQHPKSTIGLGLFAQALGPGREADAALQKALALEPFALELRLLRASLLEKAGQGAAALIEARRAVQIAPRSIKALVALAGVALRLEQLDPAQAAAARACALAPRELAPAMVAAQVALAQRAPDAARALLAPFETKADAQVLTLLGRACAEAGQSEAALGYWDRAISAAPEQPDVRLSKAVLLQSLGQKSEAESLLRAIIADHPQFGPAYRSLAYGVKLKADDPVLAQMQAQLDGDIGPEDRRLLQFAMARAMETSGQTDRVFSYLVPAKAATFARYPFNHDADLEGVARIVGPMTEALAKLPAADTEAAPIFVTGMPRSGTTLIEQILAAHSQVSGGGELGVFSVVAEEVLEALGRGQPVSAAALAQVAEAYGTQVAARTGAAGRVTDKSIHSFLYIGVIRAIFPKGRIVVVQRDPRDAGLSMYRNQFVDGRQRYANDLTAIGQHYGLFHRMVAHWRDAAPGQFHEVRYEDVLSDPEGQTRALLAACDLPWEAACLDFHKVDRRVDTLSFEQVRQPLYTSSRGGWRQYETELQPLIDTLIAEGVPLPD